MIFQEKKTNDLYDSPSPSTAFIGNNIEAIHSFEDEVHTLKGEIKVPTPCHAVETEVIVRESYPEQVVLVFHIEEPDEQCIQLATDKPFERRFRVSRDATFEARVNSDPVDLVLIESEE